MPMRGERLARTAAAAAAWLPTAIGEICRHTLVAAGRRSRGGPGRADPRGGAGAPIEAVTDLCAVTLKTVCGVAASLLEAPVLLVCGLGLGRIRLALAGIWGPLAALGGGLILFAAKLVSLAQTLLGREGPTRGLTPEETARLWEVFGATLDLTEIRVAEGHAGLFSVNDRPFTLGDVIYLKRIPPVPWLLLHETVHVWQYRHRGPRYALDAILAQVLRPDAYDWSAGLARQGPRGAGWLGLNPEAQAQLVEEAWRADRWSAHAREARDILSAPRGPWALPPRLR